MLTGLFAAAVALAAGGGATTPTGDRAAPAAGGSYLSRLLPAPAGDAARARGPLVARVRRLPLKRRAAQVVLAGFSGAGAESPVVARQRRERFGGLALERAGAGGAEGVAALTAAVRAGGSRASRPLIFTTQEGGRFSALPALPPARALGRTRSVRAAVSASGRSARALRRIGIQGVLGPVLDVGAEDGSAVGERAFSDDPEAVAALGRGAVRAYRRAGVLAAPKHFPGLGAASASTEEGPGSVGLTIDALRRRDLRPFAAAVRAGAGAVVIGHGLYGSDDFVTPASQSRFVIGDLLRRELSFRGLVVSDDLGAGAITTYGSMEAAAVASLRAGVDMVHVSGNPREQAAVVRAITTAVRRRRLPAARLDEAVLHVLEAKGRAR